LIEIGKGSIGTVYSGRYQGTIPVAVKKVDAGGLDSSGIAKELKMFSLLQHPKVIRFYGHFTKRNQLYLAVELGHKDLRSYLVCQAQGIPFRKVMTFSLDIAESIAFLHSKDIIHLDIKSSNVIVCDGGTRETLKITDFGTSRKMIGTTTQSTLGKSGRGRYACFRFPRN
jgi:serine/threonine protein kinase